MAEDNEKNENYWGEFEDDANPTTSTNDCGRRFEKVSKDGYEQSAVTELYVPVFKKPDALEIIFDPVVMQTIQLHQFKRFVNDPSNEGSLPELPSVRVAPKLSARLPELTKRDAHELMRKGCAALGAQVGFQEALELITDVTQEKLEELCEKLKVFHERRLLDRESAFSTAVQQMMTSVGLQSPLDLRDFYERRVRSYRDRLLAECQDLISEKR